MFVYINVRVSFGDIKKKIFNLTNYGKLLPARASEQGNVIGLVSVYICVYVVVIKKKL